MASVASALRTAIVDANITNITTKVYRDAAPDAVDAPFVTFSDDLARIPAFVGDGAVSARTRLMHVYLWQLLNAEDVTLIDSVLSAIDSATLTGADKKIFGCRVTDIQRFANPEENTCQHTLVVDVTQGN